VRRDNITGIKKIGGGCAVQRAGNTTDITVIKIIHICMNQEYNKKTKIYY